MENELEHDEFLAEIEKLFWLFKDPGKKIEMSEKEMDNWITQIEKFSPNSDLSGLLFWGETVRTPEEIVAEARKREAVFQRGGRPAVRERIKGQMNSALQRTDLKIHQEIAAETILRGIIREESESAE